MFARPAVTLAFTSSTTQLDCRTNPMTEARRPVALFPALDVETRSCATSDVLIKG